MAACPDAPRRYRGKDTFYWIMQLGLHGPEYGLNGLTVAQLPSPAARFACNPLLTGANGGHDIHLRDLGRRGVRLHGHLAGEGVKSVLWATGYRLDFGILDIPVLDEWNYPRHSRGVTEHPGLYAVGLPWLTGHSSAIVAGVGRDAEYIAEHIAGR